VVKGALFARYSRSPKSLRRLLLDEFMGTGALVSSVGAVFDTTRAEQLYERVFFEYGDDSVAQLGGVHLPVKARRMSSPRSRVGPPDGVPRAIHALYSLRRPAGGRYRYHVPKELPEPLRQRYVVTLDRVFDTYRAWLPRLRDFFAARFREPRAIPSRCTG